MTDRRTYFFLAAGLAVLLIQPIVPEYRWLTMTVAILYFVFAALFTAANLSARQNNRTESRRRG